MSLRLMAHKDIPSVQEVARMSWHDTYSGIIPQSVQDQFLEKAYSKATLTKRINQSIFLVKESEERIVGFANFSKKNQRGVSELGAIYLLPTHQGKHIGTELFQKGIHLLDQPKRIIVYVEKENNKGFYFYEAKGFKAVETFEEIFFGHKLKTIKMILDFS